jgi:hypothetical protein
MTPSAGTAVQAAMQLRRRAQLRFPMRSLAYVRLDQNNGGVIRDLTENGMALQAVMPLRPGDQLPLRFELFSPRVKVETLGHVAWADSNGQAGISFTNVPDRLRRQIRDWMLLQMLSAAAISGRDSMFAPPAPGLVLSPAALPAISIPIAPEPETVRWGLLSMSVRGFGLFVDTLILLCSVLLFSISAIAVMGGVPPLPLAGALLFAASAIFTAAYQVIFSEYLCGASPGKRLAQASGSQLHFEERTVTRFR